MVDRLLPRVTWLVPEPDGERLSTGAHITFYAPADTNRTEQLQVLDPTTKAPIPGGYVTGLTTGVGPLCILRGDMLTDADEWVDAVDSRGNVSSPRLGVADGQRVTLSQLTTTIAAAVDGLAPQSAVDAVSDTVTGLQGEITSLQNGKADDSTIRGLLDEKADRQTTLDALATLTTEVEAATTGVIAPERLGADPEPGQVLTPAGWADPPEGTGGAPVTDESVAAVVPSGATAQAIASLVGVVVRATDAEATTAAGEWGVLGLVVDEVVGSGGGTDPEPPVDTTAPVITAPSWPSLTVGSAIDPVTLSADEPVTWAISAGTLPDGLTFNAGTGTISGAPTVAGSGSVTVTGTDAAGNAASVVWSWTVAAAPVEWAPVMSEAFSSLNESAADLTGRVADNALGGTLEITPTIGTYTGANELLALRTSTTAGTYGTGQPYGVGLSPEVVGGVGTDALLTWAGFEAGDRALDFKATSGYNAATQRMDAGYRVYLYYNPVTRARIGAMVYRSGVLLEVTNGSTQATTTTPPYATNQTIELRGIVAGGDLTVTLTVRKTDGTVNGTPVSLTTPAAGLVDAPAVAVHYPDSANMGYGSLDDLVVYRNVSTAPTARSVLFSEQFSSHDETQAQVIARSPDNYAGGTVTTPPTAGAFAQATAGTVATSATGGTVGVHAVGAGLRLGAQGAAGTDVALRYALPAEPRHAEFTVTSAPAVTNVVVMLHEAGTGTYAWAQVNTGNLTASARSSYGTARTSTSIPFSQGDRIRVESVLVGADTQVTATNLTTGSSTVATLAGADVTARASMAIQYPVQFGKGSIDDLVVYSGGAA